MGRKASLRAKAYTDSAGFMCELIARILHRDGFSAYLALLESHSNQWDFDL
jgi:hypothetical protein